MSATLVHDVYGEGAYCKEYEVTALAPATEGAAQYTWTMALPGVPFGVIGGLGYPFS